jgi:hypothetical protein
MSIPSSGSDADPLLWGKIIQFVERSGGILAVKGGLNTVCFKGEHAHLFPRPAPSSLQKVGQCQKQHNLTLGQELW